VVEEKQNDEILWHMKQNESHILYKMQLLYKFALFVWLERFSFGCCVGFVYLFFVFCICCWLYCVVLLKFFFIYFALSKVCGCSCRYVSTVVR